MDLTTLLYLTGASGFFTSRAFVPAFCTAALMRYGHMLPWLGNVEFLQATGSEPTWFTSNWTLLALGVLALIEIGATKVPEAQELMDGIHKYAKTAVAGVAALGIIGTRDAAFIEQTISQANVLDSIVSGGYAAFVFLLSSIRSGFFEILLEADPDDDLGIRTLISWFEDLWSSFGVVILILYPLFVLAVLGAVMGFFYLMKRRAETKEEQSRVPCVSCGEKIYACAPACCKCKAEQPSVQDVGFFGQTINRPAQPAEDHAFRLLTKRRCPKCATRIKERKLPQVCSTCGTTMLGSISAQQGYVAKVRARLPKVLGITFLLSLVPFFGIIPGIIYYRVQLIAPFRAYISASRGLLLRWVLRLIFLLLISVQLVPGLGGFMVPVMALISYSFYSGYFKSQLPSQG